MKERYRDYKELFKTLFGSEKYLKLVELRQFSEDSNLTFYLIKIEEIVNFTFKLTPYSPLGIDVAPAIFNIFPIKKSFEKLCVSSITLIQRIEYFSNSKLT